MLSIRSCFALVAIGLLAAAMGGCGAGTSANVADASAKVPHPVDLLLPQQIRVHPFTSLRTFPEYGDAQGLEVRVEALDAYEDNTKAFGDFRFELYAYKTMSLDHKGQLLQTWSLPLLAPKVNMQHWDSITRTYLFKLQITKDVKPGQWFVLRVIFQSPYTKRTFAEYTIAGK